ncbi:MAG TPA: hypothetical protein VNH11_26470 [Pirellulales bacterium]|nr:hypothetical protein [Pirellulales bacterium]
MPTDQITEFLRQLRSGNLDAENPAFPEHLSAADFLKQVRDHYPVVFQERSIGRKTELGLARSLQFELAVPGNGQQTFPPVLLFPVFRRCLLISTYDDHLSGIAMAKSVRIRPSKADRDELVVTMGGGYKLDKMPDGWTLKDVPRRSTVLSEAFLRARGWQFDRLRPFALQRR